MQAKELSERLKGCPLYLVGVGPKKTAVGRVLARRLTQYRCYDVGTLMCATYKALSGSDDDVTLAQLLGSEPVADLEQLGAAVLQEVQPYTRSVFVSWDGAARRSDYMVMQQGIVVNIEQPGDHGYGSALQSDDGAATLESWRAAHKKQADVTVALSPEAAADDAAYQVGPARTACFVCGALSPAPASAR